MPSDDEDCMRHAEKVLADLRKKAINRWSPEEDQKLLQLAKLNKCRWNLVATHFPEFKTPDVLEARYNKLMKR
ncbi:unnamed protein product [Ambrosiozyma monospora]|uniref:Unnamed protein product n=1 Tax=Ambrosiozyma monospora TaxID=43982 RepID=A0ACB5TBM1_AMBMO|nr:unnamed protein product [Ambrosiozyma monospora]